MDVWRIVLHPTPMRGAWNMAVDEALLESTGRGDSLPTLRLYAWSPACLSLGYAQPVGDVDRVRLERLGWDLVRRPTGGRAVLHVDELTYSVTGPTEEPRLAGTVLESYSRLAEALVEALSLLGLPVTIVDRQPLRAQASNPVCFEVPSTYEITVGGKKLVGSAQTRRREGVLQHGALPLTGDITRILQVLSFPEEEKRMRAIEALRARATTVESVLGRPVSWQEAAAAFQEAFARRLNLRLVEGELTAAEEARAHQLQIEKYENPAWTYKQ
ncbi:MAG: lipoate--protein ligase family protein [Anaerolineales bacterium]|nr:lipoate--protein ligase family protein [Anaerolineales bacterium]MCX7607609.1 lipoate--protein ligase family protein [Anaerolineales bacterium]MDW8226848.1 biotin/lipoate A/B protein ligase family protein [Anaerolineales bacterium]